METQKLILKHLSLKDKESIYKYASDKDVGPMAGWLPHKSIKETESVIENYLMGKYCYGIFLKETMEAIGVIEIMVGSESNLELAYNEAEIGFWIGKPYWGKGLMKEAVLKILDFAFRDLDIDRVLASFFHGNNGSMRVLEKCGFNYLYTYEKVKCNQLKEIKTLHVSYKDNPYRV